MSKTKLKKIYALRDKNTKKIVRATKCNGGTYYEVYSMCKKRCDKFNGNIKSLKIGNMKNLEYEVGEYVLLDIDEYTQLFGDYV